MTRGNQRDLNRAKTLKKKAAEQKGKGPKRTGEEYTAAKERDAEIMRAKQQAAQARKAAEEAAGGK